MSNQIYRAEVIAAQRLTPGMVRVTFGGAGLSGFTTTGVGDEYLRVFFPHGEDRRQVSLPYAMDKVGWDWPEGVPKSPLRTYTVRDIRRDGDQVEVDIDFVVHDGGIAATWAQLAAPGDVVGLNSPNPLYDPPENLDWQYLIADQAGLPAAGRLLAATPAHVRTKVVIEVPDADHQQPLPTGPHIEVTWIHGGNGHGPSRLHEVVRSAPTPGPESGYIWVAGEAACLRSVRKYLRHELGLPTDRYKVVGYWTFKAEEWNARYEALSQQVQDELMALWSDESRDEEEIEDEYIDRLERLGL
jgi:NADPH-dependent ferric siderophore reductase